MVVGPADHTIQADIIFVIEGTAINGAYINDLKSNYIIPTLEYFSQGSIEENICESTSTLYGIVTYQAADCLPNPCSDTYGPYTSPQKVLMMLEKIGMELVGGKGESCAHVAEGLATALVCLEDLAGRREAAGTAPGPGPAPAATPAQRHCVLVCSSPPYAAPARETPAFDGHGVEQLASVLNERNIHLSILSPRKIPALFKLYEKAGGDLPSQTKNYAKDPRHLVLLKGYSLKERPISPGPAPHPAPLPLPSMSSPLPNNNSPQPQPIFKPAQQPPVQAPVQPPAPPPAGPVAAARAPGATPFPPMGVGVPYGMLPRATAWRPMMPPQAAPRFAPTPEQAGKSALIAQLTQPPNMVTAQFNKDDLYFEQGGAGSQGPPGPRGMAMMGGAAPPGQLGAPSAPPQPPQQSPQQPQQTGRERHNIWQGMLEWIEKSKTQNDAQKNTRHVPCQVSAHCKDGEPELKADSWPQKLIMQLMPKQLIGNIGGAYLKNSKSVLFHPQPCEALESLTKVMSSGFAGCVHFTSLTTSPCDIKVLILLYTAEKRAYLGFIPNDQAAFVDRLRKVIQNQKTAQLTRQGQGGAPGQNPALPAGMAVPGGMPPAIQAPSAGPPGMGMMARTLSGMNQPQNPLGGPSPAGAVVNQPGQGLMQPTQQGSQPQGPQGGLQFNYQTQQVETARKQNLAKIEQLRQTLEAAQQQEQQFQKQIELGMFQNPMKVPQGLQDQQMDNQFKSQLEEQQKQQLRAQLQQQLQQQQQQQQQQRQMTPQQQQMVNINQQQTANQQRMLRPAISNNPGLRHLLQQPQYRQQMPQMMQSMQRNANNPQQFDDSTFDFLN